MADDKERIVEHIGLSDGFRLEAFIIEGVLQWRIVHHTMPTIVRLSADEALAIIQMQRV